MGYYPAMIDLTDRLCLVVGGGEVGRRKVSALLEAGARVRVIEPAPDEALWSGVPRDRVELKAEPFSPGHLDGVGLVVAATDDPAVNAAVFSAAWERNVLVNVVDAPAWCSFIVPAVVRRGDLLVAVSTSGASPAVAARIRREIEARYGPEWGPVLTLMRRVRERLLARGRPPAENRGLFQRLADSNLVDLVAAGDESAVNGLLAEVLGPGFSLADLEKEGA
jgi:precorrin-2 dehydrogenase/sirohydrochlorin ferrochelatase